MSTFVLIPGAGGVAWYWSRVVPLLKAAGHDAIAVDLPGDDEAAGLPEYRDLVVAAMSGHDDVVLVAQSLGGFTAPLACERAAVTELVFVNAMIPMPGETPGAWWDNTGAVDARLAAAKAGGYPDEFDPFTYFLHDVPPDVVSEGEGTERPEADAVFASTCDFNAWPDVPTRVLTGSNDRFFPPAFQQTVARDRLGVEPDLLPGGHLIALAQPTFVAEYLLRF
jgi:pimeloyl-ACP methyl ester carboxylesterase